MIAHLHPLLQAEIKLEIVMKGETARSCLEIAERRKQRPVDMLADAVKIMIDEDMIDAIIDDGRGQ